MLPRDTFLQGLKPTLHIAHRGGALVAPENTLEAFRLAVEKHHTDMLELDVHLTRDGEVIVAHDDTLERCTNGEGPLAALTLAELRRLDAGYRFSPDAGSTFPFRGQGVHLPTLREVLRAFPSLRLNVELKPDVPGGEDVLARLLTEEDALGRVCLGSEQDAIAERLVRVLPDACHFYPRDALAAFILTLKAGEAPPEDARYAVLDMPLYFGEVRLVDDALLKAAAERGKWINVWTVDDPAEMDRLLHEGIGGIMTDRPDLLRQRMDASGKPG
ncbi:glycerophosphodiester phosphodiesterase [Corallococcus praedator]|uniref:Glycerophosphodiester phosphodiesterase n=1 Tax=Corallococcus praedator TaxID=2316724 RepID=A0ABX9Q719_9BACT|nr:MULTISPECIES: glycerophosphodiester phosphodiesterase [Corallococcus]RKH20974.1 glycerophosphodiester phosphodiesterase [Corallococcus sp. CA031C]RKH90849.1 glycerophosphodiester phosphodiesterase [Corallococcus praedator]